MKNFTMEQMTRFEDLMMEIGYERLSIVGHAREVIDLHEEMLHDVLIDLFLEKTNQNVLWLGDGNVLIVANDKNEIKLNKYEIIGRHAVIVANKDIQDIRQAELLGWDLFKPYAIKLFPELDNQVTNFIRAFDPLYKKPESNETKKEEETTSTLLEETSNETVEPKEEVKKEKSGRFNAHQSTGTVTLGGLTIPAMFGKNDAIKDKLDLPSGSINMGELIGRNKEEVKDEGEGFMLASAKDVSLKNLAGKEEDEEPVFTAKEEVVKPNPFAKKITIDGFKKSFKSTATTSVDTPEEVEEVIAKIPRDNIVIVDVYNEELTAMSENDWNNDEEYTKIINDDNTLIIDNNGIRKTNNHPFTAEESWQAADILDRYLHRKDFVEEQDPKTVKVIEKFVNDMLQNEDDE